MNRLIFFIVLIGCFQINKKGHPQDFLVTYSYSLQKYETKPESIKRGEAILAIKDTSSLFMDKAQYQKDTTLQSAYFRNLPENERTAVFLRLDRPEFSYYITKSYSTQELQYAESINKTMFSYLEGFPEIAWEIKEDTARILGYICQKANGNFAGRDYVAWFSGEASLSDGPYKFSGLPGIILKLNDTENKINFEAKGLERISHLSMPQVNVGKRVSKTNFMERKDHYYLNRIEYRRTNLGNRKFYHNGREESPEEFYEGLKQEYLDRVWIERR